MFKFLALMGGLTALNAIADQSEITALRLSRARLGRELVAMGIDPARVTLTATALGPALFADPEEGILTGVARYHKLTWIIPPGRRFADLLPVPVQATGGVS